MACHEASGGNWQGQHIKRGQLITGRKRLAKDLKLTERQIRTSLTKLKMTNEVTIEATSKNSVITITNYDTYNPLNIKRASKPTNETPTSDQRATTLKNVKNEKELKETNSASKSSKRKKAKPVRDNPPSYQDLVDYCNDQEGFSSEYLDLDKFWHYYVTDQDGQWQDKNGKDVMNWKHKLRTWHESGKKNGTANNNYVQDQGQKTNGGQTDTRRKDHLGWIGICEGKNAWCTWENPCGYGEIMADDDPRHGMTRPQLDEYMTKLNAEKGKT